MSRISTDEVARVAGLAHIALTDEEITRFEGELDAIADAQDVQVDQQELQEHILFQSQRYGMQPAEFIQQIQQSGQLGNLFADVRRGKALAIAICRVDVKDEAGNKVDPKADGKKPLYVKYGLNHCVALIEAKKANLVVIADDVDPIELVVFVPALCRKMGIPYVIVKSSSRLGAVVHLKRTAIAVIQDVRSEDERELADLVSAAKANYLDKYDEARRHWGGGIRGNKSVEKLRKRVKAAGQSPATVAKESL